MTSANLSGTLPDITGWGGHSITCDSCGFRDPNAVTGCADWSNERVWSAIDAAWQAHYNDSPSCEAKHKADIEAQQDGSQAAHALSDSTTTNACPEGIQLSGTTTDWDWLKSELYKEFGKRCRGCHQPSPLASLRVNIDRPVKYGGNPRDYYNYLLLCHRCFQVQVLENDGMLTLKGIQRIAKQEKRWLSEAERKRREDRAMALAQAELM